MSDQKTHCKRKNSSGSRSTRSSRESPTNLCDSYSDSKENSKINITALVSNSDAVPSSYEPHKTETSKNNAGLETVVNLTNPRVYIKKNETAFDDAFFANIKIKEEVIDEPHSPVSDINPPVIPTRAKWRLYNRRKSTRTVSSTSSNFDSYDTRKTKSEPIIIDISDDSSDDVSVVSPRPSRIARVQGELLRKFNRHNFRDKTTVTSYKDSSDSSSEDEKVRYKRKPKKGLKAHFQSSSSKRKRYYQVGLKQINKKGLRLKRQKGHARVFLRTTRSNSKAERELSLKKLGRGSVNISKRNAASVKEKIIQEIKKITKNSSKSVISEEKIKELRQSKKISSASESEPSRIKNVIKDNSAAIPIDKMLIDNHSVSKVEMNKKSSDNCSEPETAMSEDNILVEDKLSGTLTTKNPESTPTQNKKQIKNSLTGDKAVSSSLSKKFTKYYTESEGSLRDKKAVFNNNSDSEHLKSSNKKKDKASFSQSGTIVSLPLSKIERKPILASDNIGNSSVKAENASDTRESCENVADIAEQSENILDKSENNENTTDINPLPDDTEFDDKSQSDDVAQQSKCKNPCKKQKLQLEKIVVRKRGRPKLTDSKFFKKSASITNLSQPPFLQNSFCFDVASKLPKCRECRIAVNKNSKKMMTSYCRFMEYRKLCINKAGSVLNAGFSRPTDATKEHLKLWLPQTDNPPKDLNKETSKALLEHIGDQFCDLIEQEKEAKLLHLGADKNMTWKRIVQGVREMCDVCDTTIFNIHWVCPVCGLAVCIDCYKMRKQGIIMADDEPQPKNRDEYKWLLCSLRQVHDQKNLVMAQIIPGQALWTMQKLLHEARDVWKIPSYCKCHPIESDASQKKISTGICKQLLCLVTKSFSSERNYISNFSNVVNNTKTEYPDIKSEIDYSSLDIEISGTAAKWLEESNFNLYETACSTPLHRSTEDFASIRSILLEGATFDRYSIESDRNFVPFSTDDIFECMKNSSFNAKDGSEKSMVKHFSHRLPQASSGRDPLPIRVYTGIESNLSFSDVPHSWLCNGRLLLLHKPHHENNLTLFQEQWKRGQPILVKGVDERLDMNLWHPDGFCRDFGEIKNDLVNCKTGIVLKNLPMKRFWEGFENFSKRMKDDHGEYMLLKLKDWPPGEDFSEKLPKRFHDLMNGLPLPDYTHRDGVLNLAGRLPSWFVRPDLGPKMYNAYGSALYPTKGTTNLHLDISDAVNVMVYVGIPRDGNDEQHIQAALKAIDEGGCDSLMRARVRSKGAKPGALWHIYNARDTDKIRDMLTKVAIERGEKLEANHDPIHDQNWYIDTELRKRLYQDYGVEGYAIAQCLGDAVFIPAGAPHQVRNLHSCVKVAEDFVSPENIAHCFKLTQEFRHLSDTHTNHEDKLQIKNIIYHVVRDALAHLVETTVDGEENS